MLSVLKVRTWIFWESTLRMYAVFGPSKDRKDPRWKLGAELRQCLSGS